MNAESAQGAAGAGLAFAVEHLSVSYPTAHGWVQAVRDVCFSVRQGELVGLAGESGSGKSTLVLAATRVLRPPAVTISGHVCLVGRDVLALNPRELRAVRWSVTSCRFGSSAIASRMNFISKRGSPSK